MGTNQKKKKNIKLNQLMKRKQNIQHHLLPYTKAITNSSKILAEDDIRTKFAKKLKATKNCLPNTITL